MNKSTGPSKDDYSAQPIPRSLGILAYCSANWKKGYSQGGDPAVFDYLVGCGPSVKKFVEKVVIYTVLEEDCRRASSLPFCDEARLLDLDLVPHPYGVTVRPLPVFALMDIQSRLDGVDYVYYSEADQVVYVRNPARLASRLDSSSYWTPHRFERAVAGQKATRHERELPFEGVRYILRNTRDRARTGFSYLAEDTFEAYGAAWLCRSEFLARIDFSSWRRDLEREDICTWTPMTVACHRLMDFGQALKTSDPYDFFVDHLSGYDNAVEATRIRGERSPSLQRGSRIRRSDGSSQGR